MRTNSIKGRRLAMVAMPGALGGRAAAGLALLAMIAAASPADACNYRSEIRTLAHSFSGSASSASGTLCGYHFDASSPVPYNTFIHQAAATGTVNGASVALSTSARNFDHISNSDTITIHVNGNLVYSGPYGNIGIDDAYRFLAAIGTTDSGAVTAPEVQRTMTTTTVGIISRRIMDTLMSNRLRATGPTGSPIVGISGGDEMLNLGLWTSFANTWLADDQSLGNYNGTVQTGIVGADIRPLPELVTGLAITAEGSDIDTKFNGGNLASTGFTITPYIGLNLFDGLLTWDLIGGYGYTGAETKRRGLTLVAGTSTLREIQVNGNYGSRRLLVSSNLAAHYNVESWQFSGRVGYLAAWDHRDNYDESDGTRPLKNDTVLGEFSVGGRISYSFQDLPVQPYLDVAYLYDNIMDQDLVVSSVTTNDRDEILGVAGIVWYAQDNLSAGLEVSNSFGRQNISNTTLSANLRFQF